MTEPAEPADDAQDPTPAPPSPAPQSGQSGQPELPAYPAFGAQPAGGPAVAGPPAPQQERVLLGLLAALVAVLVGLALTVAIWRAGYVAAITSLVIAFGAAWLYTLAAGQPPRRGLVPLVVLILVGVAASFFAVVASDLMEAYDDLIGLGMVPTVSKSEFVRQGLTDAEVLSEYGKDMALFGVFAALGIFGTVRRLVTQR